MATKIEWTEETWNPTTGCDRVSPGCDNCYALTLAKRLKGMGQAKYQRDGDPATSGPGFGLTVHDDTLTAPLRWRKRRRVFVNSMSDLFHQDVPDHYIDRAFGVMAANLVHDRPTHTFQLLTKRHARMRAYLRADGVRKRIASAAAGVTDSDHADALYDYLVTEDCWPLPHVWLGVSVENQQWADIRIPALMETPAAVRWISAEPLLGPVELCSCGTSPATYDGPREDCWVHGRVGLDWVVAGGESGPDARPIDLDWVRAMRDQCAAAKVAFFFKQVGGRTPKAGGRDLDGREWSQYPLPVAAGVAP